MRKERAKLRSAVKVSAENPLEMLLSHSMRITRRSMEISQLFSLWWIKPRQSWRSRGAKEHDTEGLCREFLNLCASVA